MARGFVAAMDRIVRVLPLVVGFLAGCGGGEPALVPIRGRVLFNDRPLAGAEIAFHPDSEGPGWMPVAVTGGDGSFEAGTKEPGDGALPGRYRVTVVWRPAADGDGEGPNLLPARYARPDTSGLEVEAGPAAGAGVTLRLEGPTRGRRP